MDCSREYNNESCNGGLPSYAYNYIIDHGVGTEKDYPYEGHDDVCQEDKRKGARFVVKEYQTLTEPNVENLSKFLARGPVSVAL